MGVAVLESLQRLEGGARAEVSVREGLEHHCGSRLLAHVEAASAQLSGLGALLADESSRAVAGRFEWVDGVLARAIVNGGWVLMDNANLCNPTVLDRLNPLLEPNGVFARMCLRWACSRHLLIPPSFSGLGAAHAKK
eukprot:1157325-Pelagomonas_calceolata.AAC.6